MSFKKEEETTEGKGFGLTKKLVNECIFMNFALKLNGYDVHRVFMAFILRWPFLIDYPLSLPIPFLCHLIVNDLRGIM